MKQIKRAIYSIGVLLVVGTMLCGTAFADVADTPFPDVPAGADYAEAAATLAELGIFQGDDAGNFNPNKTISRAETAAVICRMLGVEDEALAMKNVVFTDVPATHWAVGYVAKAAQLGIIGGYGNGKFGPEDQVTYEQMVKMLVCAWGHEEWAQSQGGYPAGYLYVAEMMGLSADISGFNGPSEAPRWGVAVLCYRVLSAGGTDEG